MLPRLVATTPDAFCVVIVHLSTAKRCTEGVRVLLDQLAQALCDGRQGIQHQRVIQLKGNAHRYALDNRYAAS